MGKPEIGASCALSDSVTSVAGVNKKKCKQNGKFSFWRFCGVLVLCFRAALFDEDDWSCFVRVE